MLPKTLRDDVAERLTWGRLALGPLLSKRLREGDWELWAILPRRSTYSLTHKLEWGDMATADATTLWLSRCIEDFLRREPGRIAIFENDPASHDDPWLSECKSKVTFHGSHVLHYVRSGDTATEIERAVRDAHSAFILIGVVCESLAIDLRSGLSDGDVAEVASNARAIILDAFDGESYVVAEPVGQPSIAMRDYS